MDQGNRFEIYAPLIKLDLAQHLIYGRATSERPDSAGESCDYPSAVSAFTDWSEAAYKRSGGKSRGGIREMHQNIASGHVVDLTFNDQERAIDLVAKVDDESTWRKCVSGTLCALSIGGGYKRKWRDPQNPGITKYDPVIMEVSIVDNPSNPDAIISLLKADGSTVLHKLGQPIGLPVAGDQNNAEALDFAGNDQDPSAPRVQAVRAGLVVRDIRELGGAFLSPELITYRGTDWTDDPYPDPLTGPIYKALALQAVEVFNAGIDESAYTMRDKHILGRRLTAQAAASGVQCRYDPFFGKIEVSEEPMQNSLNKIDLGALIAQLAAAMGVAVDQLPSDQRAALMALAQLANDTASVRSAGSSSSPSSTSSLSTPSSTSSAPGRSSSSSSAPSSGGSTVRTTSTPTPPPGSGPTTSSPSTEVAKLSAQVASLADTVNKLIQLQSGSQVRKFDIPAGDLSALVKMAGTEAEDKRGMILSKLLSGDPHALRKAAEIAGSTEHPDADAVYEVGYRAAVDSLAESGAFSELYRAHRG